MNRGLWIARKNYLCGLIRRVDEGYGGKDMDLLRSHCRDVLESFPDDKIEEAIDFYEIMVDELDKYPPRTDNGMEFGNTTGMGRASGFG